MVMTYFSRCKKYIKKQNLSSTSNREVIFFHLIVMYVIRERSISKDKETSELLKGLEMYV